MKGRRRVRAQLDLLFDWNDSVLGPRSATCPESQYLSSSGSIHSTQYLGFGTQLIDECNGSIRSGNSMYEIRKRRACTSQSQHLIKKQRDLCQERCVDPPISFPIKQPQLKLTLEEARTLASSVFIHDRKSFEAQHHLEWGSLAATSSTKLQTPAEDTINPEIAGGCMDYASLAEEIHKEMMAGILSGERPILSLRPDTKGQLVQGEEHILGLSSH